MKEGFFAVMMKKINPAIAFWHTIPKPIQKAIIAAICILLAFSIGWLWGHASATPNGPEISSRAVQLGLRNVGELHTQAAYCTNVQVIRDAKELWGKTIPLTQSQYIFSYDTKVMAGVQFDEIEVDLNVDEKKVTVKMPEVEVLGRAVDQNSLEVYDERRSIFTPLTLNDIQSSLSELEEEAVESAVDNGILDSAKNNAENVIRIFIIGMLGSNEYTVEFVYE